MGEAYKRVVIPITLTGENYLLWARTAKTNLGSAGLWNHIKPTKGKKMPDIKVSLDEDEEESVLTPEEEKWVQEDQVVLSALQNSLETSILQGYSYCARAKELWDTLKTVYGDVSNLTRVFEVKKAINNLRMDDLDFKKHFGKFRSLWAELEMLRPHTVDPKELNARREQDKVFGLLLTLNPFYNGVVQHMLRDNELPTLDSVCSKLQKEQGNLGLFTKEDLPTAHKAMAQATEEAPPTANKGSYKPQDDRKNAFCEHCKKKGHVKEKCWLLHPHLKPSKFKEPKANLVQGESSSAQGEMVVRGAPRHDTAMVPVTNTAQDDIVIKRADLEALIQSMAAKFQSGY